VSTRRVAAACLLISVTVVGCSPSVTGHGSLGLEATLERIRLQDSDLGSGYTLRLMPGGALVRGQITLDNCGFDFTTEAHRVARRQYEMVDATSHGLGISNELVAYDSPQQASKAIAEWHTAAARCPRTAVRSRVAGTPDVMERITRNDLDVATLPVGINAVTEESATTAGYGTFYNISVLQAKGRFLDNMYLTSSHAPTAEDLRGALALAAITGQRLAASR
jgi:hypothetical protein